jgi:hypothetical protein
MTGNNNSNPHRHRRPSIVPSSFLFQWRRNIKGPSLHAPFVSFSLLGFIIRCISVLLLVSTIVINVRLLQSLTSSNSSSHSSSIITGQNLISFSLSVPPSSSFLNFGAQHHLQQPLSGDLRHPHHHRPHSLPRAAGRTSSVTTASDSNKLKQARRDDVMEDKSQRRRSRRRIRQQESTISTTKSSFAATASSSLVGDTTTRYVDANKMKNLPPPAAAAASASAASVSSPSRPLWESSSSSTVIPRWMKDYFAWHAEQRRKLQLLSSAQKEHGGNNHANSSSSSSSSTDLKQFRFLVVRCLQQDDKCGGTADRLKPLPFYLRLAHALQRILVFKWERPVPLEEFLQPPTRRNSNGGSVVIGMDWTWPSFLDDHYYNFSNASPEPEIYNAKHIKQYSGWNLPKSINEDQDAKLLNGRKRQHLPIQHKSLSHLAVVSMRYQSHGHGADEYNWLASQQNNNNNNNETTAPKEATFEEVFRDAWHVVFEPVPAIQQRIDNIMTRSWNNSVQPNMYDAIHIRALYHNSQPDLNSLRSLSRHAVNCLHTLQLQRHDQEQEQQQHHHHANTTSNNSSLEHHQQQQQQQQQQRQQEYPVFIASDDVRANDFAHAYANRRGVRTLRSGSCVISNATHSTTTTTSTTTFLTAPLHLDRGVNFLARQSEQWTTHEASRYYDVFVDLYLLANARCIAYNVGNFGKWANLLSRHPDCEISHLKNKCEWKE